MHPLCVLCELQGRVEPATCVDHISAMTGPNDPRWYDASNHRSLCQRCHSAKTVRQDGGKPR
jgi:5-methylcytosine-specific restriction enzyme A